MKIAIIGSGGREHALVHHLSNSKKITKIWKKLEKILYAKIKLKKEDQAQDKLLKI